MVEGGLVLALDDGEGIQDVGVVVSGEAVAVEVAGVERRRRGLRTAWVSAVLGDVVRHGSFDKLRTGSPRTPGQLTTNGVGHVVIGRSGAEVYRWRTKSATC